MKSNSNFAHARRRVTCITMLIIWFVMPAFGQLNQQTNPRNYPGQTHAAHDEDVWEQQQRKSMEKKANLQRQQDIRKDTEKLLELATELKQAVDKSNQDTLSLDVVRKAEEIEKLAKSVKNKMKGD